MVYYMNYSFNAIGHCKSAGQDCRRSHLTGPEVMAEEYE